MSASELDNSGTAIGIKLSEWEQTGSDCLQAGSPPSVVSNTIDPTKPNCISNGARQLCLGTNPTKPGCGTVNGVEWCPEKTGCGEINGVKVCVPTDGGCQNVGGGDYACTKTARPNPAPNNEAAPIPDFKVNVPVQDANGAPAGGLTPGANGGVAGPGTVPGEIGHYPGPSGNGGSDSGTQPKFDTTGLAKESNQMTQAGLLGDIKNALTGNLSGSGFSPGSSTAPDQTDISPEITTLRGELSSKLSSVRSEYAQIISFGSSGQSGGNLQCPPDSGFVFMGSNISLCTQAILNNTASIGNILIFIAAVVALYILLS